MNPLFTVIVLSFNQKSYLKTSLQSVFEQSYPNIELIFADDASVDGTEKEAIACMEALKSDHVKSVQTVFHQDNVGTVRNVNDALKKSHGEYILFFAADDALYDENVLDNFRKSFDAHPKADLISGQCLMMDDKLEKEIERFLDEERVNIFNAKNSRGQFEMMARECFLAMGATAFRASTLQKYGWFDERYKIVEDWSWMLKVLRKGGRAFCAPFNALLHRDGGISHSSTSELSKGAKLYRLDIYNIYLKEVLPYLWRFSVESKVEISNRFNWAKAELHRFNIPHKRHNIFRFDPIFSMNMIRWKIMRDKKILPNLAKLFACSYVAYFVLLFIIDLLPETSIGIPLLSKILELSLHWIIGGALQLFILLTFIGVVCIALLHTLSAIKKIMKQKGFRSRL